MRNKPSIHTTNIWQVVSLALLIVAVAAVIIASVSLTPVAGNVPSTEAEVLQKQLEFMLKMNSAFLGFLGIVGALLTWFFKNSLEDAKVVAARMVKEEMEGEIRTLAEKEFRYWERAAQPERVISQTLVDYYLPGGGPEPKEFYLVKQRGFRQVSFCESLEALRRSEADVVIADFQNCKTADGQRQCIVEKGNLSEKSEAWAITQIDAIRRSMSNKTVQAVLVVYIRGTIKYLYDPKFEDKYVLAANNQVTLVGHAGSGAYVAFGAQQASRP